MRHGFCLKATRPRPEESLVSPSKDGSEPERGAIRYMRGQVSPISRIKLVKFDPTSI